MQTSEQARDRLIGFRVTEDEHQALKRAALSERRTLTGMLRKLVAKRLTDFGIIALVS
jgi:uncharacterized protein (DUF1778 family)